MLGECLLAWSGHDPDDLEAAAAALRVAEVLEWLGQVLTHKAK